MISWLFVILISCLYFVLFVGLVVLLVLIRNCVCG